MSGKRDITGIVSGYLTVVKDSGKRDSKGGVLWECLCECGNTRFTKGYYLKHGKVTSCGCKNKRTRTPSMYTDGILYWIHDMHDDDIYSQGYVGITSCGFRHRVNQHFKLAAKGAHYESMNEGLRSKTIMAEQILSGDLDYVKEMERHFRPQPYIGWNRAIGGGEGGAITHGLSGNPIKATYYGMLTRAKESGAKVDEIWLGEYGLPTFYKDVVNDMERNCNINYEETFYTYYTLANKLGIKSNTLQYRLLRGWTLEEAISGVRAKRLVTTANGSKVPYNGSLSDEDFEALIELRLAGKTTIEIGKIFRKDPGQISRLCSMLKVKPNEIVYD